MKDIDVQEIWDEIQTLKEELQLLKDKRVVLENHTKELEQMHDTLTREAERAERLVQQVKVIM